MAELKFWLTFPVPLFMSLGLMLIAYVVGIAMGRANAKARFKMDKKAQSKYEGSKGDE